MVKLKTKKMAAMGEEIAETAGVKKKRNWLQWAKKPL